MTSAHAMAFSHDHSDGDHRHPSSFSEMDKNGDGVLTQDEVEGPMQHDFSQIDTNGDGELTQSELDTFMQNHQPPERPQD
jgi:hypothetical protein